jgi:hypothetical protein
MDAKVSQTLWILALAPSWTRRRCLLYWRRERTSESAAEVKKSHARILSVDWNRLPPARLNRAQVLRAAAMRFGTYRDEQHSRNFDVVGDRWTIDLVSVTATSLLLTDCVSAIVAIPTR